MRLNFFSRTGIGRPLRIVDRRGGGVLMQMTQGWKLGDWSPHHAPNLHTPFINNMKEDEFYYWCYDKELLIAMELLNWESFYGRIQK
jgi:hypothetical protein